MLFLEHPISENLAKVDYLHTVHAAAQISEKHCERHYLSPWVGGMTLSF